MRRRVALGEELGSDPVGEMPVLRLELPFGRVLERFPHEVEREDRFAHAEPSWSRPRKFRYPHRNFRAAYPEGPSRRNWAWTSSFWSHRTRSPMSRSTRA